MNINAQDIIPPRADEDTRVKPVTSGLSSLAAANDDMCEKDAGQGAPVWWVKAS